MTEQMTISKMVKVLDVHAVAYLNYSDEGTKQAIEKGYMTTAKEYNNTLNNSFFTTRITTYIAGRDEENWK